VSSVVSYQGSVQGEEPIALKKKDKHEKKEKKDKKHKHHDHDHDHHDHHGHDHDSEKGHGHDGHDELQEAQQRRKGQIALTLALILTSLFMIAEFVGGLYTGSLAIMTDAAHLLTDVGALLLSLFAMWLASRPKTKGHSYGFHRAEILGAVASVLMIWALTGVLLYEAVLRTIRWCNDKHDLKINGKWMFIIASGGLGINLVDAVILWWGGQEHAHGHDHGDEGHGGHGHGHNVNVYSAFIHVLGDCIQSVGVMIAAALIWGLGPHWTLADPITTFLFSILVLYTTIGLLRNSLGVLMESVPRGIKPEKITSDLAAVPGVIAVHDLHVWSLTVGKISLSVHLKADAAADPHKLLKAANKVLKKNHGIKHTTIQIMTEDCDHGEICKF